MVGVRSVRVTLVVTALVAIAAIGEAQTTRRAPVRRVEFTEAIDQALARNPSVAQAATTVTQAEALLQQARSATLPFVSAGMANVTLDTAVGSTAE